MWLLVMTLILPIPSIQKHHVLNEYHTYTECKATRDQVGFNMAEAYPQAGGEFVIQCLQVERETA